MATSKGRVNTILEGEREGEGRRGRKGYISSMKGECMTAGCLL